MSELRDSFGRKFSYLRLSVTDQCNFSCVYCLPHGYQKGYQKSSVKNEFLSLEEIRNLARAFAEMGTWKIRITGGEPTLRKDLLEIVRTLKETPGIERVALSTNGTRLTALALPLKEAGLDAINVSVDSLNPDHFQKITGQDRLSEVLAGVEAALEAGISRVKLNAVLLAGWNSDELGIFSDWIRTRPVSVRWIELMPTGQTPQLFTERHFRSDRIQSQLLSQGWHRSARQDGDGPAVEFTHPDFRGSFGIIAPYSNDFCSTCNRLRVTSQGGLRLCLFGEKDHDIRPWLDSPLRKQALQENLLAILQKKDVSHYLPLGIYGNNQTFSAMGG
jgi:cyclic pyranopterin phosphate synthase